MKIALFAFRILEHYQGICKICAMHKRVANSEVVGDEDDGGGSDGGGVVCETFTKKTVQK